MKKALSVTSPNHGMALSVYCFLGVFGLLGVFGFTDTNAVAISMGQGMGDIWTTTLMISGFGAFVSAVLASNALRPEYHLRGEMFFCLALAVNLSFLIGVVINNFGYSRMFSALLALPFIVGSLFRAWQIHYEQSLIKEARAHPEEAEPVMADPRDKDELG